MHLVKVNKANQNSKEKRPNQRRVVAGGERASFSQNENCSATVIGAAPPATGHKGRDKMLVRPHFQRILYAPGVVGASSISIKKIHPPHSQEATVALQAKMVPVLLMLAVENTTQEQ